MSAALSVCCVDDAICILLDVFNRLDLLLPCLFSGFFPFEIARCLVSGVWSVDDDGRLE